MRIAQVIDTLNWGGAQKMQLFLARSLTPLGVDVTVISLDPAPNPPLAALLREAGAHVVNFPFPQFFSPRSFIGLTRFLRREKFDLVHAYLTYSNIFASLARPWSGSPLIGSFRTAAYDPARVPAHRSQLESFCLRHCADGIIANGYAVADFGRRQVGGHVRMDVLPNAVDETLIPHLMPDEKRGLRHSLTGNADRPLILSVGRLIAYKGFDILLQAFARLRASHPDAALVIAGAGHLQEALASQLRSLDLDGHAFLLGRRDDVPRLLAAADVYVNSSNMEGTPVSVLEAMSAGLPIVATRVADTPRLLADGAGLIVPPAQPDALAEALTCLLDDPSRRRSLGEAARERVRSHYSPRAWTRDLLRLYAQYTPQAAPVLAALEGMP